MIKELLLEDIIYCELGKMYSQLLFEAEMSGDTDSREHGRWLRQKLGEKIEQHARTYH